MVIYGYRSTKVNHGFLPDACPYCGSVNTMDAYVFQTYAHIFWIPVFPFIKIGAAQCSSCHRIFQAKEMPEPLKSSFKTLKKQSRTPVWTFSGLAVIAGLVFLGIRSSRIDDENTAKYLQKPAIGDVMEVKSSDTSYTLYKVGLVGDDSVFIHPHFYETDRKSGLLQLKQKGDSVYEESFYGFSKAELKQMRRDGKILGVER